jgi:hypothetical protein
MRGRSDVRSYLLTGNTRGGARAKLTHYNLFHYFLDGAFAEDAGARATIAARYSLDELKSHRPWRAFDELPDADQFARLIDDACTVRIQPDQGEA